MDRIRHVLKSRSLVFGLFLLLVGLSGCEGWTPVSKEATESDPSRLRRALVAEQERLVRFVVGYVRRQEAFRAGKRWDRASIDRLFEEALQAYERAYSVEGVMAGYRRAQAALKEPSSGVGLQAWWDSLGLDAEQQAWMARLWEEFRTSHTVKELDVRLSRYEREVVEALGAGRSEVLLWNAAVLYDMAVLVFGREEWVEEFWALVEELTGEGGGRGGMAWLGGRGWIRLAQQNTICELNSMPQFGDYITDEGALLHLLGGMVGGCEIGALAGSFVGFPRVGCLIGLPLGAIGGAVAMYLAAAHMYQIDLARWCRENYTNCENNEHYRSACEESVLPI